MGGRHYDANSAHRTLHRSIRTVGDYREHTNKLHADIVVAGLPRQGEPLCDALLRAIQPKVIVVADSAFPANRRASGSLETRLEQTQIPVVYTRISGAVKIVADRGGWKLRAMDGQTFNSAAESD